MRDGALAAHLPWPEHSDYSAVPASREQFANALSKDLVNDAARSSVHAPDNPTFASNVIEKNAPIPQYAQPIKTLEFAFKRSDISFFLFQVLETAPQGLARGYEELNSLKIDRQDAGVRVEKWHRLSACQWTARPLWLRPRRAVHTVASVRCTTLRIDFLDVAQPATDEAVDGCQMPH